MSAALALSPAMTLADYFAKAQQTDRFVEEADGLLKSRFGFFGEVGGLLTAIKRVGRDQLNVSETDVAGEELGDALWYLASVSHYLNVLPDALGEACMRSLRSEYGEADRDPTGVLSFRNIDGIVAIHCAGLEEQRTHLIGQLAHQAGELMLPSESDLKGRNTAELHKMLGDLLTKLAQVAGSFSLRLEDLARDNLVKIFGRWPGSQATYVDLFDDSYQEHERLPRHLEIEFDERGYGDKAYVVQSISGVYIGDRLTDNSTQADDYRFHDVFHLAYIAHLGWSPVIRALLKRKRKSQPVIDENQDGARAMIIEEGIATWIFNDAKKRNFYDGVQENRLEYRLLKQVQSMVYGFEVEVCPPWQWEKAILAGFEIFREIRKPENRRGTVVVDMLEHSIKFFHKAKTP